MGLTEDRSKIPTTGRIGRFAKIIESKTTECSYLKIMENSDEYNKYKPERKAAWWNYAIEKLESELGTERAVEVMKTCGGKCCGQGQRKTAKRIMQESSSVEDFLKKISNHEVKEGELEYKLVGENTIIGRYNRCFCGQVKKSKELFKSSTYCQCSAEFNKHFFEAAFEKTVEVELKQSILNGGGHCEFEIRIKES